MAVNLQAKSESSTTLVAFATDSTTMATIEQAANRHWPGAIMIEGGAEAAAAYMKDTQELDVVVIDLGTSERILEDLQAVVDAGNAMIRIIVLGIDNDLVLYKHLVAAGAADYLVKPIDVDELEASLLAAVRHERPAVAEAAVPEAKIVITIGACGGVGATTVATNAAWILAEERGQNTVLVDLDLQFGSTALSLNLVPAGGMIETLHDPDRVDQLFLQKALSPKTKHLSVLAAEENLDQGLDFGEDGVERLIAELSRMFPWVWIDVPRVLYQMTANVIANASHVFLVSDLSLAGMRDTIRLSSYCDALNGKAEIGVIVNRIGASKGIQLTEFKKGVPKPVIACLPEDRKAGTAAMVGKPIIQVAGRSKLAAGIRKVVMDLTPDSKKKRGFTLFRGSRTESDR